MQKSKVKTTIKNLKIKSNKRIADKYFHLVIHAPTIASVARPGQFVNIKVSDGLDPLLRRPLSIHRVKESRIELLYEVVGKGTELLSQRKSGEDLDIIGPLGNGFSSQLSALSSQQSILVAGGMGVAPLVFLAEKLRAKSSELRATVLIGAKTKKRITCEKEFIKLGCNVKIATDDGSEGFKGRVTDLLKDLLQAADYRLSTIYACGPRPMLREISRISQGYKIPAQISLEEHMSCGIGACLGCVVETIDGYKRVCKEGPVFGADEIIWE